MTIEEQIKEAEGILTKIRQDIDVLNTERSKLQNDIAAKREEAREQIEKECIDLKAAARLEADSIIAQVKEELKKASAWKESVAKDKTDILADKKELNDLTQELSNKEKKFTEWQDQEIKKIKSEQVKIASVQDMIAKTIKENSDLTDFLLSKKQALNNREFELDGKERAIEDRSKQVDILRAEASADIIKVATERAGIREDLNIIKDKIAELQKIKEENKQLLPLKDDIAKLDALKKEVDEKTIQLQESSKALASKQEVLREREQSVLEKEKLLVIESRKVDEKIATLKKLREEMQKSNV